MESEYCIDESLERFRAYTLYNMQFSIKERFFSQHLANLKIRLHLVPGQNNTPCFRVYKSL